MKARLEGCEKQRSSSNRVSAAAANELNLSKQKSTSDETGLG